MFNLFKTDPRKKYQREFEIKLKEAVDAQRNGNIELYSRLTTESEEILKKIEVLDLEERAKKL